MSVRDVWHTLDGERTILHGTGLRWQAAWMAPDGTRHNKMFSRRTEAAQYDAEMRTATAAYRAAEAGLSRGFRLLELIREITSGPGDHDPASVAAELRRRILPGQEEDALMGALEAVAAAAAALPLGVWQRPGTPRTGRPRTAAQAAKDAQAAELHRQGLQYREIAAAMGWRSPTTAFNAVRRALADQIANGEPPERTGANSSGTPAHTQGGHRR